MEIKPFLPVVKNKNKSNVENCKKKITKQFICNSYLLTMDV